MTLKEFTSGERLTSQDLNDNFGGVKIHDVYTGTSIEGSGVATLTNKQRIISGGF